MACVDCSYLRQSLAFRLPSFLFPNVPSTLGTAATRDGLVVANINGRIVIRPDACRSVRRRITENSHIRKGHLHVGGAGNDENRGRCSEFV